jgi:nucleoid-associated protein EbfC
MPGIGDLMNMMRDFGQMRERMQAIQQELARRTVQGEAGGGLVVATVNGRQELVDLKIAPEAAGREDVALLQEMVKGAVAQALDKARELQREEMMKVVGGLPLPPGLLDSLT